MMFWISSFSVLMSLFSFLILLIRILSLCPLVRMAKGLYILNSVNRVDFHNEPHGLVDSLNSSFFVSTWLISALSLIISCLLLLLGEFDSFCSRAFRCAVKLLIYFFSSFFLEAFRAISFPVRNAFIVFHSFWCVVATFSLNSKKPLISFFISSFTKLSLSRALLSFHVYVGFLLFLLL